MSISCRPETPGDEPFLRLLFREAHGAALAGLDAALVDVLLAQQFAGRTLTYRARHPDARSEIIEHDGQPIGRLVSSQTADGLTIVDIAVVASWHGRGVGTAVLTDVLAKADAEGLPARLVVQAGNPAERLYARLGFVPVAATEMDVTMERPGR